MDKITNFYYKHFSKIETSFVFAMTALVIYFNYKYSFFGSPKEEFLYTILGSIVGLLGFVIAFTAIIFSLHRSDKLVYFQKLPSYKQVFSIFTQAIGWMTFTVITLILMLLLSFNIPGYVVSGFVVFTCLITLVKISRCIWVTTEMFNLSVN